MANKRPATDDPSYVLNSLSPRGLTVEAVRQALAVRWSGSGDGPAMVAVDDHVLADGAGASVRVLVPVVEPRAVIVYLHGGGGVAGGVDAVDGVCRKLAERTGCSVVVVDYPLGPENPYLAGVQAFRSTLEWIRGHSGRIAADSAPIIVMGVDAGGALALDGISIDESGDPGVAQLILVAPMLFGPEAAPTLEAGARSAGEVEILQWMYERYVADSPRAIERLGCQNIAGTVPPTVILTGAHDPLCSQSAFLARRLEDAGVDVSLHRYQRLGYGFFEVSSIDEGEWAVQDVVRAVDRITSRRPIHAAVGVSAPGEPRV